jgi:hypothetical protein
MNMQKHVEKNKAKNHLKEDLDRLKTNDEFLRAARDLNRPKFQEAFGTSAESLANCMNFESFKRSMQALKSGFSKLSPDVEALYIERVEQMVKAYKRSLDAAETISALFAKAGFDAALERYHKTLFQLTPAHPFTERVTRFFQGIGATEADIVQYRVRLKANEWNPFRFGANGKLSGLVQSMKDRLASIEKELDAVKHHGIPAIEGAAPVVVVAVGMVVVAALSCVILNYIQPGDCIVPI